MPNGRTLRAFARLLDTMASLRSPGGCPWDAVQTPESLKPYLLEETYEVLEAIDRAEPALICDELGDLLLQIVFHARIFEERRLFDMGDVADAITDKLIRRHPHVFGDGKHATSASLDAQWERIKNDEKKQRGEKVTLLGEVPRHLPALLRARKLTEKASRVGFDWPDVDGVFAKVREELQEFEEAFRSGDRRAMIDELGDMLFAIVNLGRFLDIDAEEALRGTINRFVSRFEHIERSLTRQGKRLGQSTLDELDALWDEAKDLEDKGRGETSKT